MLDFLKVHFFRKYSTAKSRGLKCLWLTDLLSLFLPHCLCTYIYIHIYIYLPNYLRVWYTFKYLIYMTTGEGRFVLWAWFFNEKWAPTERHFRKLFFYNYLSITAFSKHYRQLQEFVCLFGFGLSWVFSDHPQHSDFTKMEVSIWQSQTKNACLLKNAGQRCKCGCTSAILP